MREIDKEDKIMLDKARLTIKQAIEENLPGFVFEKDLEYDSDYGPGYDKDYWSFFFREKYERIDVIGVHFSVGFDPTYCSYILRTYNSYDFEYELSEYYLFKDCHFSKEDFEITKDGLVKFIDTVKKQNNKLFKYKK